MPLQRLTDFYFSKTYFGSCLIACFTNKETSCLHFNKMCGVQIFLMGVSQVGH